MKRTLVKCAVVAGLVVGALLPTRLCGYFFYVSPGITVETYETFANPRPGKKCYHSDHFPIVSDITIK